MAWIKQLRTFLYYTYIYHLTMERTPVSGDGLETGIVLSQVVVVKGGGVIHRTGGCGGGAIGTGKGTGKGPTRGRERGRKLIVLNPTRE